MRYPVPSGVKDIDTSEYDDCFVTLVEFINISMMSVAELLLLRRRDCVQGYEKGIVQGSSTFSRRNDSVYWGICGSADEAVFAGRITKAVRNGRPSENM